VPAEAIATVQAWAGACTRTTGASAHREQLLSGERAHIAVDTAWSAAEGEWITIGVKGYAIEDPRASGKGGGESSAS